jgi:exodeoxyribonuclease VII large subunit
VDQLFVTEPPEPPRGEPSFTVSQLNEIIGGALQQLFPDDLWVEGEISSLTRSRAGHVYFDLIEPALPGVPSGARLSVVLFSQTKQIVNSQLKRQNVGRLVDGMAVRVRAAVDFYQQQGRLQLRMTGIDPRYILAAMAAERDALLIRLQSEGITERNGSLTIPMVPLRVGLITSTGSAAEADFLNELASTGFGFHILTCDSRVQGDLAPRTLISGLRAMYAESVDVIVLIRGGGSRGDLAVFDNEQLARTIADSPVPVLTGIGHEIDRSVADEVAHTSLKTPTAVAAALGGAVARYVEHVEGRWDAISIVARSQARLAEQRLASMAKRGALAGREGLNLADQHLLDQARRAARAGREQLVHANQRLDVHVRDLPKLTDRVLRSADTTIGYVEARVRAADPAVLIRRGWSITRTADGDVVRAVEDVAAGDTLVTAVANGTIISNVSLVEPAQKETLEAL